MNSINFKDGHWVDVTTFTCSCQSYYPTGICKHMRTLLSVPIDEEEMLMVIKAINGNIDLFLKNYTMTQLMILQFRQEVIIEDDKIIVLE